MSQVEQQTLERINSSSLVCTVFGIQSSFAITISLVTLQNIVIAKCII